MTPLELCRAVAAGDAARVRSFAADTGIKGHAQVARASLLAVAADLGFRDVVAALLAAADWRKGRSREQEEEEEEEDAYTAWGVRTKIDKKKPLSEALHCARVRGHTDVEALLAAKGGAAVGGSPLAARQPAPGDLALCHAVAVGDPARVRECLPAVQNVGDVKVAGVPLAAVAADLGFRDVVAALLEAAVQEPEPQEEKEKRAALRASYAMALCCACERGHVEVVRLLVDKVIFSEEELRAGFLAAAGAGQEQVVQLLLATFDNDYCDVFLDKDGALLVASRRGHAAVVFVLLTYYKFPANADGDADARDCEFEWEFTMREAPLWYAARNGHLAMVEMLLEHGATVDAKRDLYDPDYDQEAKGGTALLQATLWGHSECMRVLLEHGADPNQPDVFGETPLHHACSRGHANFVSLLLAHGADVSSIDCGNTTPLHIAVQRADLAVVRELLAFGAAEHMTRNEDGFTPLDFAVERDDTRVLSALLEAGVPVDAPGWAGSTALNYCASFGSLPAMAKLLAHGAAVDAVDRDGRTPLAFALNRFAFDDATLLLTAGASLDSAKAGAEPRAWEWYHRVLERYAFLAAMQRRRQLARASYDSHGRKRRAGEGSRGLLTAHLAREVARFL